MRKVLLILLSTLLALSILAGCAKSGSDKKIIVGASPTPHAEILEVAKEELESKGYELEIKEFTDYFQPNMTLDTGDLDANYFLLSPILASLIPISWRICTIMTKIATDTIMISVSYR